MPLKLTKEKREFDKGNKKTEFEPAARLQLDFIC